MGGEEGARLGGREERQGGGPQTGHHWRPHCCWQDPLWAGVSGWAPGAGLSVDGESGARGGPYLGRESERSSRMGRVGSAIIHRGTL